MENKLNINSESVPKTPEQWFKFLVDNGMWEDDIQSVKIICSAYPGGVPQDLLNIPLDINLLKKKYRGDNLGFYTKRHLKYLFDLAQQQYEINNPKPYYGQVIKKIKKLYTYVRNKRLWYDEGKLISFLNKNFEKEKLYEFLGQTLKLPEEKIKRYKELYAEFTTIKDEEARLKSVITLALNEISEENSLRVSKISNAEQPDDFTVGATVFTASEQKKKLKKIKKLYIHLRRKNLWYNENKLVSFLSENFLREELREFLGQTLKLSDKKIQHELDAEFTTLKDEEARLKSVITLALNEVSKENSLRVAKISDAEQSDNLTVSVNLSATSEQKTDLEPSDNASIIQDNCNALKENNLENKESDSHDTEKMSQSISYDEVDVKASDIEKRKKKKSIRTSPDYEQSQITAKESGNKGEEIVLQYEKNKLKELSLPDDKINSVRRVSLISDDYGYDIVSYNELGEEIYIEVKSTRKGLGNIDFFYTDNELQTAKRLQDKYKIYLVFDVLGNQPIIRNIGNPIVNNKVTIKPIQYSVNVRID